MAIRILESKFSHLRSESEINTSIF